MISEAHSTNWWPGQTHFGFGTAALAGQTAVSFGVKKVFVLADPGLVDPELTLSLPPHLTAATGMEDIDIPIRLGDVGVKRDLIPALAKAAYVDLNW